MLSKLPINLSISHAINAPLANPKQTGAAASTYGINRRGELRLLYFSLPRECSGSLSNSLIKQTTFITSK